jgi:hypothetical protein
MRILARVVAYVAPLLLLASCGSSRHAATNWKNVESVTVTVSKPGLPPPGGLPHTTTFTTQADLTRVTNALNAHGIDKRPSPSSSGGCAGGAQIAITITEASAAPTHLSAYSCGGKVTGDAGGDVSGFLSAMGSSING